MIVVVPAVTPDTTPEAETVAAAVLLEDQVPVVVADKTNKVSLSLSVSLAITFVLVNAASSSTLIESSTATGASLTVFTVTVSVPVSSVNAAARFALDGVAKNVATQEACQSCNQAACGQRGLP